MTETALQPWTIVFASNLFFSLGFCMKRGMWLRKLRGWQIKGGQEAAVLGGMEGLGVLLETIALGSPVPR